MTEERTGEAFEFGEQLTVVGRKLAVGDTAPEFTLDQLEGEAIKSVRLSDTAGEVRLLNVINSVDTPVCHIETHRWDKLRTDLPPGVVVYTVSMDLPFAQGRWGTGEGVGHALLSAHRDTRFAEDYGVLLKEWRLLQRSVFVIDGAGFLTHVEYVADQMMEPDYDAAVAAVRAVA
jgi:thiol peroxidase